MTSPDARPRPAPSGRDLRMLCLHGYHGSGAILRQQMAPLAATLSANVELVYADAPSLSAGDFGWWHEGFRGWERSRDWGIELLPHRAARRRDLRFQPGGRTDRAAGRAARL